MMIPEKKKAIGIILSKYRPDGTMHDGGAVLKNEEELNAEHEALKSHAADIIEAIHSKSAHDLMVALVSFLEQHELHEESESEEEEKAEHSDISNFEEK
jgi:hypothetical protein